VEHQDESNGFDRVVAELQRRIVDQERAVYSAQVIQEAQNPTNMGRMDEADAYGIVHGWCGDTMEIYLRLSSEEVAKATFITDGCGPSVACGNMIAKMVEGKTVSEACEIEPEDLISALDGLPEENAHCAELAVKTLREAIASRDTNG